ncbi:MAG: hypothetical protein ACQEWH_08135 [Bacillota bacterium]
MTPIDLFKAGVAFGASIYVYVKKNTEYLMDEFYSLYEYLNICESIDNFTLSITQAMVILENERELEIIKKIDIEFVDEETLQDLITLRIGLRHEHDIQLHYCLKSTQRTI